MAMEENLPFGMHIEDNPCAEPPKIQRKGRVCSHPECDVILNAYNPKTRCYVHYKMKDYSSKPKALKRDKLNWDTRDFLINPE
jgi:hypothetical protein